MALSNKNGRKSCAVDHKMREKVGLGLAFSEKTPTFANRIIHYPLSIVHYEKNIHSSHGHPNSCCADSL
jgi:hypothetical protein